MNKLKVYLAGDIDHKNQWRAEVLEECLDCPIEFLAPIDNITFQIEDTLKIDWTDVLFAYLRKGSHSMFSGTSFEIGYAYHGGKKIMIVCDMKPAESHFYQFVLRVAHVTYPTLSDGIDGLRHIAFSMQYQPTKE